MMKLFEIETMLQDELNEFIHSDNAQDSYDYLHELVDSYIPVYTYDLLQLACDDLWLAVEESEFDSKTPVQGIINNLYEHLYQH